MFSFQLPAQRVGTINLRPGRTLKPSFKRSKALANNVGKASWFNELVELLSCLRMVGISVGDYLLFSFAVKHCCGHSSLSLVSENHVVISKLLGVWWIMFLQRVELSSNMRDWAIPRYLGRPCKWSDSLVYWVWIRFQNDEENLIKLLDSFKTSQLCGPWWPLTSTSHAQGMSMSILLSVSLSCTSGCEPFFVGHMSYFRCETNQSFTLYSCSQSIADFILIIKSCFLSVVGAFSDCFRHQAFCSCCITAFYGTSQGFIM